MDYFSNRRSNLLRNLKPLGVEAVLVTHDPNVRYLTGFSGGSSYVLISPKQTTLISDDRFSEQLKEEFPTLDTHVRPHNKSTPQATAEFITKCGFKSVGLEGDHTALSQLEYFKTECPKVSFVPFPNEIEKLRSIKDPMEVEQIRTAIRAAERAFQMFKATLREQDTEKEMADNLEKFIRRAGAVGSPFPVIAAVGDHGALPHAVPGDRSLSEASKLLVDFGADCGYKCDLTRTLKSPFGVNPNRKNKMERVGHNLEEIHGVVVAAQEAAAATLRAGIPAKEVDSAARKVIQKAGYEDYFNHGLGHGIGLEVHELPRIRQNSDDVLEAGMVVTLEPGIYLPGWGGVRLEDDYLVTRDGCLPLSSLSKNLNFLA
ncbi:MAG: Xaa-Pro peptidase family protein [Gemmataceae bacterium]